MDYTNIYESLEKLSADAGTNLTKICREAKVNRSILERWKKETPKTLDILARLLEAIDRNKKTKIIVPVNGVAKLTRSSRDEY